MEDINWLGLIVGGGIILSVIAEGVIDFVKDRLED